MNLQTSSITFEQFSKRKEQRESELKKRITRRKRKGFPEYYSIDLDLVPVIEAWKELPFSYVWISCSGTPEEHDKDGVMKGYFPVEWEGETEGPQGYILAHTFKQHKDFRDFDLRLRNLEGADLSKSLDLGMPCLQGCYKHHLTFPVPREAQKRDRQYLEKRWTELKDFLDSFRGR